MEGTEWEDRLGINDGGEQTYVNEDDILAGAEKLEMMHHLEHTYSAATQCSFQKGTVVVIDGREEVYRVMRPEQ